MSGLSIHEKRQLAEQLARELLNKSGQYRFGIPQSVLNAKANEFMRLSDKELQQKFNEYFQSTGLNAKPKDLWDSMGLNLEQKKKAQANMKSLQAQVNKKYMRPTSANTKKVGAKQVEKPLPKDVKKEVRQFMATLLQQTYSQKVEEFRNYLLNNKTSFAELGMELHDLGAKVADGLTSVGVVVDRSDTRAEIREKLIDKQAKAGVLADYVDDEEMFNKLFKEYFNEDFDYQTTFDYICATNDFSTTESSEKIEKFTKKLNNITKYSIKSADDYMKNASGAGGLLDLAFNVALICVSGGSSAIAKYAQMTAKGGTEVAGKVITNVAGKKIAQSTAGQAVSQGVGIVAAQTTSAGLNAVAFQGTKVADLAGETLATGEFNTDKAENIVASAEGLFKFGYVGGAISGPLGMQVKNLTTKLLNSKPIINQILTKGITNKPTPLTSVLKDISEHSEAIGEVLKFGTEFGINAGYMAYDDGTSYTDAMANLAQMDGVSKMVLAMLGAKNMSFLTPEKVQQIKTDLAGYKVNIAVKGSQKVYSVKDAQGKETVLSSPEELFMFILDKEAKAVGVKAETKATSSKATKNDAKEIDVAQTKDVAPTETTGKKPYVKPEVTDIENVLPKEVAQYLKSVANNTVLKKAGITPDVATQMMRETTGTYGELLPSSLKMIEHFESILAKGEEITPDIIYNAIQKFDSNWAKKGYGSKFQTEQRDLISKYWKNSDKDFAEKFNVAMSRTPEIMQLRTEVAQNPALKKAGITPDVATQMMRETTGTYGSLLPSTLDMISYMQSKIDNKTKLSSILVNEAFHKFNKGYAEPSYGSEFQNLQRDLIAKYWKNAGENFDKIYDVGKYLDIDTPVQEIRTEYNNAFKKNRL